MGIWVVFSSALLWMSFGEHVHTFPLDVDLEIAGSGPHTLVAAPIPTPTGVCASRCSRPYQPSCRRALVWAIPLGAGITWWFKFVFPWRPRKLENFSLLVGRWDIRFCDKPVQVISHWAFIVFLTDLWRFFLYSGLASLSDAYTVIIFYSWVLPTWCILMTRSSLFLTEPRWPVFPYS